MSFDEEILVAIDDAVAGAQQRIVYAATVATVTPFEVIFDGTTTPVPVLCDGQLVFQPNDRVVVIQNGADFVAFANYSPAPPAVLQLLAANADPNAFPAGQVFFRADLTKARMSDGATWRSFLMEGLPAAVTTLSATAITATSLNAGSGAISTSGTVAGGAVTATGTVTCNAVSTNGVTASGTVSGNSMVTSGTSSANTFSGNTLSVSTISGSPSFSGTPTFGNVAVSSLTVSGNLAHNGGGLGFFGGGAVSKGADIGLTSGAPAAYSQAHSDALAAAINACIQILRRYNLI